MYWRHVVASTLKPRDEFVAESVNSDSYKNRHMGLLEEGFSFSGFERDKVWLWDGGRYLDVSAVSGADDPNDGRALCLADFDDDGDQDFFVHNIQRERHRLYRNDAADGTGHHSVKVTLQATRGHASAAGAVVEVEVGGRTTAQLRSLGGGFLSQDDAELVFGLGDEAEARVTVRWPGRDRESFGAVAAGARVLLVEGTGEARPLPRWTTRLPDPTPPGLRVGPGARMGPLAVVTREGAPRSVELADGGPPWVVSFWASYCVTCVAELPDLQRLARLGTHRVLMVGMDAPGQRDRAAAILAERAPELDAVWYSDALVEQLLDPRRMPLPTTLFLDAEGVLQQVLQAPITHWQDFPEAARAAAGAQGADSSSR